MYFLRMTFFFYALSPFHFSDFNYLFGGAWGNSQTVTEGLGQLASSSVNVVWGCGAAQNLRCQRLPESLGSAWVSDRASYEPGTITLTYSYF